MIGYVLCCEEHPAQRLLEHAVAAERAGFSFAFISDHFHPWNEIQGHSPNVWPLLGALAGATSRIRLGTAVTCPILRIHPAVVAHAAATSACLLPDRFFLGVGTGENLNEHVVGKGWPAFSVRLEMLQEAIAIIRLLFEGESCSYHGRHFRLDEARLYDLPDAPPPILMACSGYRSAALASRLADGLIALGPDPDVLDAFGSGKPRYAQLSVCWAPTRDQACHTAHRIWPEMALPGMLYTRLETPAQFERACRAVSLDDVGAAVVCGPDPEVHLQAITELLEAGFDHVAIHQIGPDQSGFLDFYRSRVIPRL